MDFEGLASRLGIDGDEFLELVELFISTTQSDMDKIQLAETKNLPSDAAAAAHSIKGAAGNMGFDQMADLAEQMEFRAKEGNFDGFGAWMDEMTGWLSRLRDRCNG